MFSRTSFLNILEKATSHLQLEPDWNSIIAVSDCIRQGDVEPKFALNSIKKKLTTSNLHVTTFALLVLESCVKNCGPTFHAEIATKSFMEELHEIVKNTKSEKIKDKILELIQTWAHAFRNQTSYRPVLDMFNLLKLEGYKFPHLKESDAMFSASVAPEWVDGDCCHRCRTTFTIIERRHHCRACGQVFCNKCSSKQSIIPKFGIEKEVRVCEDCYEKINTTTVLKTTKSNDKSAKPSTTSATTNSSNTTTSSSSKTEEELREEEELQMAIALSKSEAEIKEKQQNRYSNNYNTFGNFDNDKQKIDPIQQINKEQLDPNLNLYMNRAYWEQKSLENKRINETPSAPQQTLIKNKNSQQQPINKSQQNEQQQLQLDQLNKTTTQLLKSSDTNEDDIEQFQNNLKSTIEIFVNRMNSNKNRGRPISNDSAVQSMFLNITNMHSQLLKHIQQQDDLRSKFELLQDKLSQARDARAALDSLREEYNEKIKREAEEAELIRQQQMAYKLDMMRKKKQEYLQYQHQIALQRVQDQEREMKIRLEQQKYGAWPNNQQQQQQLPPLNHPQYQPNNIGYPILQNHQYNNYDYSQLNNQNHLNYAQQNGNLTQQQINTSIPQQQINTSISQQQINTSVPQQIQSNMPTVLSQPQNSHIPLQQSILSNQQQPPQLSQQPNQISQSSQVPTSVEQPSNTQLNYSNQPPQQYQQGVYNMQALNNSLPIQQQTNLNQQTQINAQQFVTQTSLPETESNNLSTTQINKPQIEEAPLISFD